MEKLQDDLWLACSVQRHGLNNWEMVAVEFSDAVFHRRRCILDLSPTECQVMYQDLRDRFMNVHQMDYKEDDESVFVKFMVDKLTKEFIAALREDVKLRTASIQKNYLLLFKLEAEERIELKEEEDGDKSNKMGEIQRKSNTDEGLTKILDLLRSHKHCCLFESRLRSQGNQDYTEQIKQHMDLQIIQEKLEQDVYSNFELAFFRDLLLMFNNAIVYYPKETLQHAAALELRDIVRREMNVKPLFRRDIVCGLPAEGNTMLVKEKTEKRMRKRYQLRARETDESVRRSARVRSRDWEMKNDPDYEYYDCRGPRRSRRIRGNMNKKDFGTI